MFFSGHVSHHTLIPLLHKGSGTLDIFLALMISNYSVTGFLSLLHLPDLITF